MSRVNVLLEKAISACVSGIEIYNKPDFKYREETFTILMINAWELLLKAKILKDNNGNIRSIYVTEPKKLKSGLNSNKQFLIKTSRSGNPMTIELLKAMEKVSLEPKNNITTAFKENIITLCEIRDNAIHFKNDEPELNKKVLEYGTASLKNFLNAVKNWFSKDLSKFNFYLMPLSFYHEFEKVQSFSILQHNTHVLLLLNYLNEKATKIRSSPEQDYNLVLTIETKFVKSPNVDAVKVRPVRSIMEATNPATVQEIMLTEEEMIERYPWNYKILKEHLIRRYIDFKYGESFNDKMVELKQMKHLCYTRIHNPLSAKPNNTYFYSPNCLQMFFDKFYGKFNS